MAQIKIGNKMVEYASMSPLLMNHGNTNYKYKGNSGIFYKYDLSNAIDQQKYEMDLSAQMNDSLKINVQIDLDRNTNQYGGGIE